MTMPHGSGIFSRRHISCLVMMRETVVPATLATLPDTWVGVTGSTARNVDFDRFPRGRDEFSPAGAGDRRAGAAQDRIGP